MIYHTNIRKETTSYVESVQLNEEVSRGRSRGGHAAAGGNAERAAGKGGGVPDAGCPLTQRGPSELPQPTTMTTNLTDFGDVTLHVPRPQGRILRDCHHRAVSPSREQRGGSPHRDVSGRRLRAPCGGLSTEALWGSKVSPATISELNKKATFTSRTGGTLLQGGRFIHTSTWTASTCAATGRV